jgi:hypothetical protein
VAGGAARRWLLRYGDSDSGLGSVSLDDLAEMYAFADRRYVHGLSGLVDSMTLQLIWVAGDVPVEMLGRLLGNTVAGRDGHYVRYAG